MGRGSGGASGFGARDYSRLRAGKFRTGDMIGTRGMGYWASGYITARGIMGSGRNAQDVYLAKGPKGQVVIPVNQAYAVGIR